MAKKREGDEKTEEPGFEARTEALERLVKSLEDENLSLEASIERYREGVAHVAACRALLDGAEKRLVELVRGAGGGSAERELRVGADGLEDAADEDA
ncbi:MAG: exodeoxyribonuclease VII small subunit [Planctomycetota bacterium]